MKNQFSWKSTGKVVPKDPVPTDRVRKWGRSYRMTIRKMFDAERKELTDKISAANIL